MDAMRKTALVLLLGIVFNLLVSYPVDATGARMFDTSVRPRRLLTKQFATNANNFLLADPTPDGSNQALTSATGRSRMDGSVTVALTNGFTAPVTLTCYYWQNDNVTTANQCWVRLAPVSSGGISNYTQSVDSHYTTAVFAIPENTPYLITSSGAITGNVYVDSAIEPSNPNSPAGYDQN